MKKAKIKIIVAATLLAAIILYACSKDFLEKAPLGTLGPGNLASKVGVEGLLIGAYSLLDGYGGAGGDWPSAASNWVWGGVASDDAYKGSDGGDQPDIISIETYTAPSTNGYFNAKWNGVYDAVNRCNDVLRTMRLATDITPEDTTLIAAQARFLRAHYHFEAKKMWKDVPWVDESVTYVAGNFNIPNTADIFPNIEADLQFAIANLPATWSEKGRVNVWAAKAYLARIYMFEHKYADAKSLLDDVIAHGVTAGGLKYELLNGQNNYYFFNNFNPATQNNSEGVFEVQNSVNDNSNGSNGNFGDALNFPYTAGPGGCCGFYQPSQSLVNSYQVDANGLPLLDTWNNQDVKNDQGLKSADPFTPTTEPLDPRLDLTVGRRGIPYLDWGPHPGTDWIRDQSYGGPYAPIKNVYAKSQAGSLTDNNFWTSGVTANDYIIIRFANVLLWAAECEVEIGNLETARDYVNQIRARAANPAGWVKASTTPCSCNTPVQNFNGYAANYKIGLYTAPWTDQAYARKAVRFERKLELAMEGHRFFDLQRYSIDPSANYANNGYMADVLNAYIAKEQARRTYLQGKTFTKDEDEYFPIPQAQIDLSHGTLVQNEYHR